VADVDVHLLWHREQRMTQAETALLEGFQHLLATTEVAARL